MITKEFRENNKDRGYTFKADKQFFPDKRADITIKEESSGNKAKFSILHAFGEMDIACFTDMTEFSQEFKEVAIETLDHIAKTRGAKVALYSIYTVYNESEVSRWKDMEGFSEFTKLFKDAWLNKDAPVKIYDRLALYDRIELNKVIEATLDHTPLRGNYKMNNHLAEIQVWWKDEGDNFRKLRILSQDGYHIDIDYGKKHVKTDNIEELQSLLRKAAQGQI